MFRNLSFVFIALCLMASPAVASDTATPIQLFKQRVGAAKQTIKSIDQGTLKSWITAEKDFILLDVREPGESGAIKIEAEELLAIPRGVVEVKFSRHIDDLDQTIVVYCQKGGRGALVTESLTNLGYRNVYNLNGGILSWIGAGNTVANSYGSFVMQNYVSNFK